MGEEEKIALERDDRLLFILGYLMMMMLCLYDVLITVLKITKTSAKQLRIYNPRLTLRIAIKQTSRRF